MANFSLTAGARRLANEATFRVADYLDWAPEDLFFSVRRSGTPDHQRFIREHTQTDASKAMFSRVIGKRLKSGATTDEEGINTTLGELFESGELDALDAFANRTDAERAEAIWLLTAWPGMTDEDGEALECSDELKAELLASQALVALPLPEDADEEAEAGEEYAGIVLTRFILERSRDLEAYASQALEAVEGN